MAAKKKQKLADYVEVYLPDSDTPVRVHKEMYDDPEEWKDAVRRAEKLKVEKEQEAFDEGMTDTPPSKMPSEEAGEPKMSPADEAAEEAGEGHVTAEVSPARELTDEEVAREEPDFDPTQFNMDGSRKTAEEQQNFAKSGDRTVASTSPDEPESAPTKTTPEDADATVKTTPSSRWLSEEGVAAMGSLDYLKSAQKSGLVTDREAGLLEKLNPEARAEFLIQRGDERESPEHARKVREDNLREDNGATPAPSETSLIDDIGNTLLHPLDAIEKAKRGAQTFFRGTPNLPNGYEVDPRTGKVIQNADIDTPPAAAPAAPGAMPPAKPAPSNASVSGSMRVKPGVVVPPPPSDGVSQKVADANALLFGVPGTDLKGAYGLKADAAAAETDIARRNLIAQKELQERVLIDQQHIAEQRKAAENAYSKTIKEEKKKI